MYHPTARLLTILELLQTHPSLTGAALAQRLEVAPRSVRRYIQLLQDMGMPVEATYGPGGGYRLRPGFKLPPLMFNEDEATAVVLGLLGTTWLELRVPSVAVEGALAKITRVLPVRVRERFNAIAAHMILSPHTQEARPAAALLIDLGDAIRQQQRIALDYRSYHGQATHRSVEPYGLAGWQGRWYLAGYCCLRQDYRLFRLDRMNQVQLLGETFMRDTAFDFAAYVIAQLARSAAGWSIAIEFHAALDAVRQKIPASYGTFEPTAQGTLFQCTFDDLAHMARYLVTLNMPFVVHHPPELRAALLDLAAQLTQIAHGAARTFGAASEQL
jgi:predicted DNA-binding transcriptional regulator YafY